MDAPAPPAVPSVRRAQRRRTGFGGGGLRLQGAGSVEAAGTNVGGTVTGAGGARGMNTTMNDANHSESDYRPPAGRTIGAAAACRMFGIDVATRKHWEHEGLLRGRRGKRRWAYDRDELERLLIEYGKV